MKVSKISKINILNIIGAVICLIGAVALGFKAFTEGEFVEHKALLASLLFVGILLFNNLQNTKFKVTR